MKSFDEVWDNFYPKIEFLLVIAFSVEMVLIKIDEKGIDII